MKINKMKYSDIKKEVDYYIECCNMENDFGLTPDEVIEPVTRREAIHQVIRYLKNTRNEAFNINELSVNELMNASLGVRR